MNIWPPELSYHMKILCARVRVCVARREYSFQSYDPSHQQPPGNSIKMQVLRLTPNLLRNLWWGAQGLAFNKQGDSEPAPAAMPSRSVSGSTLGDPMACKGLPGRPSSPCPGVLGCHFLLPSSNALKCGNRWGAVPLTAVNLLVTYRGRRLSISGTHTLPKGRLGVRSSGPSHLLGPLCVYWPYMCQQMVTCFPLQKSLIKDCVK